MRISIITINFNNREGLSKTIESVVNQTYNNIQYIVIDGGSTDGSVDVIKAYADKIDFWVSEPDRGIYNAMNKGIDVAEGEYCLFLNSGDYLFDEKVIELITPNLGLEDFVIGRILFLDSDTYSFVKYPISMLKFYNSSIPHPATFIKKELFLSEKYDEDLKIVSDWKFFLKKIVIEECSYKIIDNIIACFNSDGISSCNKLLVEEEREKVLQELIPTAIRMDYFHFTKGEGYLETNYDKFFLKLRQYNYASIIYKFSLILVRLISLVRPSAKFARKIPYNY